MFSATYKGIWNPGEQEGSQNKNEVIDLTKTEYRVKNAVGIILIAFLFLMTIFCFLLYYGKETSATGVPELFGTYYWSVPEQDNGSELQEGDLILYKEKENYDLGDDILYAKNDNLAINIVTNVGYGYLIAGETNMVFPEAIHGEVTHVFKGIGPVVSFLSTDTACAIFAAGTFVGYTICAWLHFRKEKKQKESTES